MFELLLAANKKAMLLGPGPQTLIAGDATNGFFGEISAAELFTGTEMAAAIGATAGTLINNTTPWLKLSKDGRVIFIPKKAIRIGLSFAAIDALGARTPAQDKQITAKGWKFRCRLPTATQAGWAGEVGEDPNNTQLSDYNRFIYRLCVLKAPSETDPVLASYTLADLGMSSADQGCCFICQEGSPNSTYVQRNGGNNASAPNSWNSLQTGVSATLSDQYRGWRPVLELLAAA